MKSGPLSNTWQSLVDLHLVTFVWTRCQLKWPWHWIKIFNVSLFVGQSSPNIGWVWRILRRYKSFSSCLFLKIFVPIYRRKLPKTGIFGAKRLGNSQTFSRLFSNIAHCRVPNMWQSLVEFIRRVRRVLYIVPHVGLAVTLISKCHQFIFVPNCTEVVKFVKFPKAIFKISRSQTYLTIFGLVVTFDLWSQYLISSPLSPAAPKL